MISNGSGMPSFWDRVIFYKRHPWLPAINKSFYFIIFFCKMILYIPNGPLKKSVFFGKWAVILVTKSLQNTSMSYSGYEMAFYKKSQNWLPFLHIQSFQNPFRYQFFSKKQAQKVQGSQPAPKLIWEPKCRILGLFGVRGHDQESSMELYTLKPSSWDFDPYWEP